MSIQNVGNTAVQQVYGTQQAKGAQGVTSSVQGGADDLTNAILNPQDAYIPGTPSASSSSSGVYSKDYSAIQKMWDDANNATASLRNLVINMLGSGDKGKHSGQGYWAIMANPEKYDIQVDEATQQKAEQMISDEGYYGVAQTTDRIVNFAKALAGEDASAETIENLRDGIQQGFDEVAKMFGGFDKLPEVTQKTYDAVMKAMDEWNASLTGQ